jgi:hypothetical protein
MTAAKLANRTTLGLTVLFAVAGAIVLAAFLIQKSGPSSAGAADHLDAPGFTPPGGSVQTDITDVYAFRSPTHPKNTVLVLNVNGVATPSEAAPGLNRTFAQAIPHVKKSEQVTYNFHVDNNGDARSDVNIKIAFDKAKANGEQKMKVELRGVKHKKENVEGKSTAFGASPVVAHKHGITAFAGRRDDPFFFDLLGFINILGPGQSLIGCGSATSHPERNFFAGRNVSSIVLEVPTKMLTKRGSSKIGVWASTNMPSLQIDRMGRPAIATVFIPNNPIPPDRVSDGKSSLKNTYNHSDPVNDQANFRGEVVDSLTTLFTLNDATDPNKGDDASKIQGLADFLLPDILTVDTASSTGFPNGRGLNDDVIDTELGLISEGAVTTDCVPTDNTLLSAFPYLGNPH